MGKAALAGKDKEEMRTGHGTVPQHSRSKALGRYPRFISVHLS